MFVLRFSRFLFLASVMVLAGFSFSEDARAASLNFTPSSTAFKQACSSKVDLVVDTQGVSTNAVDAVVFFNTNEVTIEDQNASVPGTQIRPGSVYEIYAGNLVNESEGKILLTAFSVMGNFNGSGLLGSIYFRSKPGITSTSFQFQFTPGASTDSNVADLNGNDVLSSVNTASYTFQSAPCVADTQAPSVSQLSPANNATNVPLNTNISLHLLDNQSGVNLSTVEIQIHDVVYLHTSPEVLLTGLPLDYTFTINPTSDFPDETEIVLVVKATDIDGNVMSPKVFSFNKPVPPPPPPPPPPVPVCGNNIVEDGEACEPPGAFGCSITCQTEILQCLSVSSGVFQQAALQSQESGTLDAEQLGAITDLETLTRVVRERVARNQAVVDGVTLPPSQTVRVVTETTKTVFETLGCTENCVKVLFGERSQRWFVPVLLLLIFIVLVALLAYLLAKRISEKSKKPMREGDREKKKADRGKLKK
jgi:hypothetical protein